MGRQILMRLLLIEDDEYKAAQIGAFLKTEEYEVDVRKSFHSGMRAILSGQYDILLLDMSIPTFDSVDTNGTNRHRPFGGKDVLQELQRLEKDSPVVVITQYSVFGEGRDNVTLNTLDQSLKKDFEAIYKGMIHFDASSMDWSTRLKVILKELEG